MKLIKLCSWIAGYLIVLFFAIGNNAVIIVISILFVVSYFCFHLELKEPVKKPKLRVPVRRPGFIPHKVTQGATEMLNFYTPEETVEWLKRTYSYTKEVASKIVEDAQKN